MKFITLLSLISATAFANAAPIEQNTVKLVNAITYPGVQKCIEKTNNEYRIWTQHLVSGEIIETPQSNEYLLVFSAGATLPKTDPNQIGEEIVSLKVTYHIIQGSGGIVSYHCKSVDVQNN